MTTKPDAKISSKPDAKPRATTGRRRATRRAFLTDGALGLGAIALSSLLAADFPALALEPTPATGPPLPPGRPHFAPKAKQIIFLFMVGGPSQLDLFEHKPALLAHNGEGVPAELLAGQRFAFLKADPKLVASPFAFARHGQSGAALSELLPGLAGVVDELAFVRSMQTSQFNHGPGRSF